MTEVEDNKTQVEERVVHVNRCSKVVKGGRRFSFSALVVAGNHNGYVGYGHGKANEVTDAIRKGTDLAHRNMFSVINWGSTIPHESVAEFAGAKVLLKPAMPGTGIIAGSAMRAILELSGIKDVVAKSLGSNNKLNVVKATAAALQKLRSKKEIQLLRKDKTSLFAVNQ